MLEKMFFYFQYPFVRYALIVGGVDLTVRLFTGSDIGIETLFIYRRRIVSCGFWSHGGGVGSEYYE